MMRLLHLCCFVFILFVSQELLAQQIHQLSDNTLAKAFLVAGPFHKDGVSIDDWHILLEEDFLNGQRDLRSFAGAPIQQVARVNKDGFLNLNPILRDSLAAVGYVQFIVLAEQEAEALLRIHARDGAKVYVNQQDVGTFFNVGWSGMDISTNLKKGENTILIQVANRDWDWGLKVELLEGANKEKYLAQQTKKLESDIFLNLKLQVPRDENYEYPFRPGKFPRLVLNAPEIAKKYLGGGYDLQVRWFDRNLNEVSYPKAPGRYAYYAEVIGNNGVVLKKSATMYCIEQDWMGWNNRLEAELAYFPVNGMAAELWEKHKEATSSFVGFEVFKSIMLGENGSVLLAFLDDLAHNSSVPGMLNTPIIADGDYHARLKQKILGKEQQYQSLTLPQEAKESSPILIPLGEKDASQFDAMRREIIQIAHEWMKDEGRPFDMLIAQKGRILFHESFGEDLYGTFTKQTPSEIASITKLFTGLLFAQFLDQGLIELEDPVGKYLPDFPLVGPQAVTLRQCFTHTNAFSGHGRFDGVLNPWLENSLLHDIQNDTVGTYHEYNGMGYDLAGKVMESITGKSIFRLFREYLYDPLEMNNTVQDWDLAYSVHSTAYDLAKMAQMLLNKGRYGNLKFFSEETYHTLTPKDLSDFYPGISQKWGIGITMMGWGSKQADGSYRQILSDDVIGHGSATASVFWVIPELDLIITQSRRKAYRNFGKYNEKILLVIEKYLTPERQ